MTSNDQATTRRQLLRTAGIGAAAASFLAACGGTANKAPIGASGDAPTLVASTPTAPIDAPTAVQLEYDITVLRTATSLELLAVQLYTKYGPVFSDKEWQAQAARFAADHQAAADEFNAKTPKRNRITEPNAYIQENSVDPVADELTNDRALFEFFASLESTMAATYVTAVGAYTKAAGRQDFARYADSAARRKTVMGGGGKGQMPEGALYPTTDLIPNDAYMLTNVEKQR
ncbi:MAG: hypothetical protein U0P45_12420 [Acidimicrobiales bacterium]